MSKPIAAANIEVEHPPLARDPAGNLVPFPEETAAWRIARETGGRLFEIRGADKAWVRVAKDATAEQIAEQWGPGVYRVYALDALGGALQKEHVARWDLRNAGSDGFTAVPADLLRHGATAPAASNTPAGTTDLRFALEAMTHMLRTNSDALRMVSESHVDLAKSIAAVKGLPRNANLQLLQAQARVEPEDDDEEVDDEEEDDDDELEADPGVPAWINQVLVPLAPVIKLGSDFLSSKLTPPTPGAAVGEIDMDLVNAPDWEARDFYDLKYCHRKTQAKRAFAAAQAAPPAPVSAPPPMPALAERVMADPELFAKLTAIQNQLSLDDNTALMQLIPRLNAAEGEVVIAQLKAGSVTDGLKFAREILAQLRSANAQQTTPREA